MPAIKRGSGLEVHHITVCSRWCHRSAGRWGGDGWADGWWWWVGVCAGAWCWVGTVVSAHTRRECKGSQRLGWIDEGHPPSTGCSMIVLLAKRGSLKRRNGQSIVLRIPIGIQRTWAHEWRSMRRVRRGREPGTAGEVVKIKPKSLPAGPVQVIAADVGVDAPHVHRVGNTKVVVEAPGRRQVPLPLTKMPLACEE